MSAHGDMTQTERDTVAAAEYGEDIATLAEMIRQGQDPEAMATFMGCNVAEIEDLVNRALSPADRNTETPLTMARLRTQDPAFNFAARLHTTVRVPANSGKIWDRAQRDRLISLVEASDDITADRDIFRKLTRCT